MKIDHEIMAGATLADDFSRSARRVLAVDVERYQAFLDGSDMTQAQKEEFLQALWSIMVSFVELGFGVHPLQEVCGKDEKSGPHLAKTAFDQVKSKEPQSDKPHTGNGRTASLEAE
jgi:hypothetical protein